MKKKKSLLTIRLLRALLRTINIFLQFNLFNSRKEEMLSMKFHSDFLIIFNFNRCAIEFFLYITLKNTNIKFLNIKFLTPGHDIFFPSVFSYIYGQDLSGN